MKNFKQNYKYKWLLNNYIESVDNSSLLLFSKSNNVKYRQLKNQIFIKAFLNNCLKRNIIKKDNEQFNISNNIDDIKYILLSLDETNYLYFDNLNTDLARYCDIIKNGKNLIILDGKIISEVFFQNVISYKNVAILQKKFLNKIKTHNIKLINMVYKTKINLVQTLQYKIKQIDGNN